MNNTHNKYINLNENYYKIKYFSYKRKYLDLKKSIFYGGAFQTPNNTKRAGRFTVSPVPDVVVDQQNVTLPIIPVERKGRFTVSPVPVVEEQPNFALPIDPVQRTGRFTVSPVPDVVVDQQNVTQPVVTVQRMGRFMVNPVSLEDATRRGYSIKNPVQSDDRIENSDQQEEVDEIIISDRIILESDKNIKIKDYIFKLIKKIGSGAQGSVWLCILINQEQHIELINNNYESNIFSIKFMKIPRNTSWINFALEREIKNLKKLDNNSEFIVKTYDIINQENYVILIMEYIKSTPLSKYILKLRIQYRLNKPLLVKACIKIIEQLIKGLKYLHDNDIIHRDIKPENILIDNQIYYYNDDELSIYHIKYIDFGLSCGKYETNECVNYSDKILANVGTIIFMAPELLRRSPYKKIFKDSELEDMQFAKKTDIFSLGITIYDIFHSFTPYQHPDLWSLYDKYFPFPFISARLDFLPIKSKFHKNTYPEFAFFDFIINIMVVDDPEMRVDIDLLNTIFDGTYKYIYSIPYIELLIGKKQFDEKLGKIKKSCSIKCPTKGNYILNKQKGIKCQQEPIFNQLPLSCKNFCSKLYSWKMAKCEQYIPSIDHLIANNKTKSKEEIKIWLEREYKQHIATDQILKEGIYDKYIQLILN